MNSLSWYGMAVYRLTFIFYIGMLLEVIVKSSFFSLIDSLQNSRNLVLALYGRRMVHMDVECRVEKPLLLVVILWVLTGNGHPRTIDTHCHPATVSAYAITGMMQTCDGSYSLRNNAASYVHIPSGTIQQISNVHIPSGTI